jgi:1-acyl-sn-glycerol-3-phosphate acyltransferase
MIGIKSISMDSMIKSAINGAMAFWTMATTVIYTIIIGIPIIIISLLSRTGKLPFKFGRAWSWLLMKTNRVKIQVIGLEKFAKEKSYVFISNHSSNLDPPAIALAIPQTLRFIGKSSLAKIPIFGWAAKMARMIFIDRSNSAKAIDTINKAVKDLKDGISAFFFAEGTRSEDGRLKSFKKGGIALALKARLPIIPITIVDSYRLLPKSAIRIRPGILKIIIGDPIDISGYNDDDKDYLLQKVRNVIMDTLKKYAEPLQAGLKA